MLKAYLLFATNTLVFCPSEAHLSFAFAYQIRFRILDFGFWIDKEKFY
jgi:hypothetical protein